MGNVTSAEDRAIVASFTANVTTQQETTPPVTRFIPIAAITAGQCTPGYYCTPNSTDQIICPAGYYCPAGAGTPTPCPAGTYCPEGSSATNPCSAGHYCPEKSWKHSMCPVGFYCSANTATATKCRPGYYCPEGATAESPCPEGYYCPEGVDVPVECAPGNMCPVKLMSSQTLCPDGSYSYAKKKECTPCLAPPNGTVFGSNPGTCTLTCNDGYVKMGWRCLPPFEFTGSDHGVRTCPPCYSMNGSMCTLSQTCTPTCPVGYTLSSQKVCTPCPDGTYTGPNGQCVPCGPNSTSTPGSTICTCTQTSTIANSSYVWDAIANVCTIKCNAGYYKATATTCGICPANTYCPQGTPSPKPCPEGTYSGTGSEFCHYDTGVAGAQCPAGSWASASENMCRLCPAGTYSTTVGATSATTCITCPTGKTSVAGSTTCT